VNEKQSRRRVAKLVEMILALFFFAVTAQQCNTTALAGCLTTADETCGTSADPCACWAQFSICAQALPGCGPDVYKGLSRCCFVEGCNCKGSLGLDGTCAPAVSNAGGNCSIAEVANLNENHALNCPSLLTGTPDMCIQSGCDVLSTTANPLYSASCVAYAQYACTAYVASSSSCLANCTAGGAPSPPGTFLCGSSAAESTGILEKIDACYAGDQGCLALTNPSVVGNLSAITAASCLCYPAQLYCGQMYNCSYAMSLCSLQCAASQCVARGCVSFTYFVY
jgi:hypothetical protein